MCSEIILQHNDGSSTFTATSPEIKSPQSPTQKDIRRRIDVQLSKLMTTCAIMRIEDFTLYRVTTSGKRQFLKEFICGKLLIYF